MAEPGSAPTFFETPADWRRWLARSHARERELWVGFHKKHTGRASITWPQAVDEALCFGWIDGVRKSLDDASYMIRFTPRKPTSNWSRINVERVKELTKLGRMRPAGLKAWTQRDRKRSRVYSYEGLVHELDPAYEKRFRSDKAAWGFFEAQPPWYRRITKYWVMSAKQEPTRLRRLETLIGTSAKGEWLEGTKRPASSRAAKRR
jgi:uncharacterized protein YdeI (YjbR/CyaY-like superfamily)